MDYTWASGGSPVNGPAVTVLRLQSCDYSKVQTDLRHLPGRFPGGVGDKSLSSVSACSSSVYCQEMTLAHRTPDAGCQAGLWLVNSTQALNIACRKADPLLSVTTVIHSQGNEQWGCCPVLERRRC